MPDAGRPRVAIIDYGVGNLFSVARALEVAGVESVITSAPSEVEAADGVVLPGVGAFGNAMASLRQGGLADSLQRCAASGRPVFGVYLGLQLLMEESSEFGRHAGLGLIAGAVIPFDTPSVPPFALKVPQVGWNEIWSAGRDWSKTPLRRLADGTFMYFVHSYYVVPAQKTVVLATSHYGRTEFCSVIQSSNIFGCQFHPERSSQDGVGIYQEWARQVFKVEITGKDTWSPVRHTQNPCR